MEEGDVIVTENGNQLQRKQWGMTDGAGALIKGAFCNKLEIRSALIHCWTGIRQSSVIGLIGGIWRCGGLGFYLFGLSR